MSKLYWAVVAIGILSGPALAGSAVAPGVVVSYDWGGGYLGGTVGYGTANAETDYAYTYLPGTGLGNFSDFFGNDADNSGGGGAGPENVSGMNAVQSAIARGFIPASLGSGYVGGIEGGFLAGYNWQFGDVVVGNEADLSWLNASGSQSFTTTDSFFTNSGSGSASVNWLATDRFRVGYVVDRLLAFATAGLAFGGVSGASGSVGTDGNVVDTFAGSIAGTRVGWAASAGADYAFTDNLIGRVEGTYYNLGTATYALSPQDSGSSAEQLSTTASHNFAGVLLRVGLSYKF